MPAGNAYPSGHLVPSPRLGTCLCSDCWNQFSRTCIAFLDFSPWMPLDTLSIWLYNLSDYMMCLLILYIFPFWECFLIDLRSPKVGIKWVLFSQNFKLWFWNFKKSNTDILFTMLSIMNERGISKVLRWQQISITKISARPTRETCDFNYEIRLGSTIYHLYIAFFVKIRSI